ncbi:MAG: hypothetical protein COV99_02725 [Bacteroidetes bacterium CG12_big_fil_rev_8_21_14_0_65_60_17]|nr:MAG: hypothetical protein COV99_02725 [Bacteroidetes bacterium CG12_big_fil_rev_8_21_14_0_65_60_17]
MLMLIHIALLTLLQTAQVTPPAGNPVSEGREGNKLFEAEAYDQAAEAYRSGIRSVEGDGPGQIHSGLLNNLGASLYRQGEFESSAAGFASSVRMAPDATGRARGWYNAGNALVQAQKLEEAVEMYREALLQDPTNTDAKYNYELARRQLEEQQEQQEQDSENQDGENNEEQNGDQENSDGQNQGENEEQSEGQQDQQPNQGDEGSEQPQQPEEGESQPQGDPETLTRAEAQRMLEALQNQEEQLLREVQKLKTRPRRVDKDW